MHDSPIISGDTLREIISKAPRNLENLDAELLFVARNYILPCIGQYIENDYSILMKALLLGYRPESIVKKNVPGFKTRDGREYNAFTYKDKFLAQLDLYAYNSTIRQALGRARLIDNAVTAFFLSNKPIEGCEEITINEFFDMVKISVEGNSTTLNNRLNQTDSKRLMYSFGLINEGGELTEKGKKFIKNHR